MGFITDEPSRRAAILLKVVDQGHEHAELRGKEPKRELDEGLAECRETDVKSFVHVFDVDVA